MTFTFVPRSNRSPSSRRSARRTARYGASSPTRAIARFHRNAVLYASAPKPGSATRSLQDSTAGAPSGSDTAGATSTTQHDAHEAPIGQVAHQNWK